MPFFATIPAIVISLLVIKHLLGRISMVARPKWTRPFVLEQPLCPELPVEQTKQRMGWVIILFAITVVGLAAEVVKLAPTGTDFAGYALLVSWVCRVLFPRSTF